MRKTWLVIPVVLLSVAPLAAQQPAPVRAVGSWAVAPAGEAPAGQTAASAPAAYVLLPNNAAALPDGPQVNGGHAPLAVMAVPVVVQPQPAPQPPPPPQKPGCAGGHCGERQPCDWEHFREWLCYRSLRGTCSQRASCGCNCYVPLYVYFWGQ